MLVHNLVVTGSLTFPTSLPLSGSLLISGSLGIGTPTPDPGAVVTINKTGTGLQDVMYLTNTQAAAADTGVNLWWLGGTSLNSIGRITAAFTGGTMSTSYMSFYTRGGGANSEKMRISSSGSVGIGTTVLGWDDALITALQIKNASFYGYSTSELGIVQNAQVQGGWKYISTGAASYQVSAGGGHAFYTAPSGNASASVTWTERFGISNAGTSSFSGNVGMGTTVPLNVLDVRQASATMGNYQTIQAFSTDSAAINLGGGISLGGYFTGTTSIAQFASIVGRKENSTSANYDGYLAFGTNAQATGVVERMRITSGGILLLNTTSTSTTNTSSIILRTGTGAYDGVIIMNHATTNNTGAGFLDCYYNTTYIGGIGQNGASNVSFNTSSDYRLKEDLKDFNGLNLISNLKVYDFKWKTDDSRMYGVIAHEAQEVIPYIVNGDKDEMKENGNIKIQVVDYSKLTPILIKAIQEQQATINALTTRITALEN